MKAVLIIGAVLQGLGIICKIFNIIMACQESSDKDGFTTYCTYSLPFSIYFFIAMLLAAILCC